MIFLKLMRNTVMYPIYQKLPLYIQDKIKFIEDLSDHVIVYKFAMKEGPLGNPDFDAYLNTISSRLQNSFKKLLDDDLLDELPQVTYFQFPIPKAVPNLINSLVDLEYMSTLDMDDVVNKLHKLWLIWMFYSVHQFLVREENEEAIISAVESGCPTIDPDYANALDLSLAKLAFHIGIETANIRNWGKNKEAAAKMNLKKKTQATIWEEAILTAFSQVAKNQGDKLNRIVTRIDRFLQKEDVDKLLKKEDENYQKPSKKTIERIIKNNHQLMNKCFQERLSGNKKRYEYIGHTGV
jgi:hypothetical protein